MSQSNVINFSEHESSALAKDSLELVDRTRNLAVDRLASAFQSIMEKVDDALFELADKGHNTADESFYFDAMREVRLKRAEMEKAFVLQIKQAFSSVNPARPSTRVHDAEYSADELELLAVDQLEEDLAVNNAVTKLRNTCSDQLFPLEQRMRELLALGKNHEAANPVGPETICTGFQAACAHVEAGTKIKLLIFKLFEKYGATEAYALYHELNEFLIEQGILPKIKAKVRKIPHGLPSPTAPLLPQQVAGTLDAPLVNEQVILTLSKLLSSQSINNNALFNPDHKDYKTAMAGLTAIQKGNAAGAEPGGAGQPANVLRDPETFRAASAFGDDGRVVVDIVAMMFDYILDDKRLPDGIKGLLARLQIPILKVAFGQRDFFSRKFHPARLLLNKLADAATGYSDEILRENGIYEKSAEIVKRIVDEYVDDISLFNELLGELKDFLADLNKTETAKDTGTMDLEARRARLREARRTVNDMILRATSREDIPDFVRVLLVRHWSLLLIYLLVKRGKQSVAWRAAVETMDDLLLGVAPDPKCVDAASFGEALPKLFARLDNGLKILSVPSEERQELVAKVAQFHAANHAKLQAITATNDDSLEVRPEPAMDAEDPACSQDTPAGPGEEAASLPPLDNAFVIDAEPQTRDADEFVREGMKRLFEAKPGDHPAMDTDGLASAGDVARDALGLTGNGQPTTSTADADDFQGRIQSMSIGTWVEFKQHDGKSIRSRLSWVNRSKNSFLFTDRNGFKVAESSPDGLAIEFQRGTARFIDDVSLVDRAMSSVMSHMGKSALLN